MTSLSQLSALGALSYSTSSSFQLHRKTLTGLSGLINLFAVKWYGESEFWLSRYFYSSRNPFLHAYSKQWQSATGPHAILLHLHHNGGRQSQKGCLWFQKLERSRSVCGVSFNWRSGQIRRFPSCFVESCVSLN